MNPEYVYSASEIPRYWDSVCQESNISSYDQLARAISNHEQQLNERMLNGLFLDPVYGPKFELYGSTSPDRETRLPFFSFTVKHPNFDAHSCVKFLSESSLPIIARPGHCGSPLLMELVANQVICRISLAHYNTRSEVDAICRRLKQYVDSLDNPNQPIKKAETVKVTY